jgi:hypothetical protein
VEITLSMTAGELGQIIGLSTAIVVSLILGVRALRQTKELQDTQLKHSEEARQREHKQRILDEIIAWAVDTSNSYARIESEQLRDEPMDKIMYVTNMKNSFTLLQNRAKYVGQVASKIDSTLGDAITMVLELLSQRITLMFQSIALGSTSIEESNRVTEILLGKESDTTGLSEDALNQIALARNAHSLNEALASIISKAVDMKMKLAR